MSSPPFKTIGQWARHVLSHYRDMRVSGKHPEDYASGYMYLPPDQAVVWHNIWRGTFSFASYVPDQWWQVCEICSVLE